MLSSLTFSAASSPLLSARILRYPLIASSLCASAISAMFSYSARKGSWSSSCISAGVDRLDSAAILLLRGERCSGCDSREGASPGACVVVGANQSEQKNSEELFMRDVDKILLGIFG